MRKIRNIITAAILAVSICSGSVPVYAEDIAETEISIDTGSEVYEFLDYLGVFDEIGINAYAKEITRAKFLAIAINTAQFPLLETETEFSDLHKNHEYYSYIASAAAAGYIDNTNGAFEPDREITLNEALKILVSALGYSAAAETLGGYPNAYISIADSIGLLDKIGGVRNIDGNTMIQLIYNFLTADMADAPNGTEKSVSFVSDSGKTLLTENYKLEKTTGVITSAGMTSINSDAPTVSGFGMNGEIFGTGIYNEEKYLGLKADLYYDEDRTVRTILPHDNKTAVILPEDIDTVHNGEITVYNGKHRDKYKTDKALSFVRNGRLTAHTAEDFIFDGGKITLIDNDKDDVYEIALAEVIEYVVAGTVDFSERILYNKFGGGAYSFKETGNFSYKGFLFDAVSGKTEAMTFEEIENGELLEIKMSDDGELINFTAVKNPLRGKITGKSAESLTINGTEYKTTKYFRENETKLQFNIMYDFSLDSTGRIAYAAENNTSSMQYAFLIGYGRDDNLEEVWLKLVGTDGNSVRYKLDEKVTFDGKKIKAVSDTIKTALYESGTAKYQIIRYKVNDNGEISAIDTAEKPSGTNVADKWKKDDYGDNSLVMNVSGVTGAYSSGRALSPICTIDGTILFMVPKDLAPGTKFGDSSFTVGTSSSLTEHHSYKFDGYDFNSAMCPQVAVVYSEEAVAEGTVSLIEPLIWYEGCVVENICESINEDDEIVKKLTVVDKGTFKSYYISKDIEEAMQVNNIPMPEPGDIVRLTIKNTDKVYGISIDAEYDEKTGTVKIKNYLDDSFTYRTYISGKAFAKGSSSITILGDTKRTNSSVDIIDNLMTVGLNVTNIVKFRRSTKECQPARLSDVVTALEAGEESASYVCVKTEYGRVRTLAIYVD